MTTMLLAILGKIWPYVLGLAVVVAGWFTAKAKGRAEARTDSLETSIAVERDWQKEQRNAEKTTGALDDAALRKRAADRMRREQRKQSR